MTVQEAVGKAKDYLREILPEYSNAEWQLEELETPTHRGSWIFTFSAASEKKPSHAMSIQDYLRPYRVTKVIEVDSDTGDLIAIRNKAA
ncbi:MAG: hypothetical protein WA414_21110, partial [Acidobacteriaceae bacterium]